MFNLNCNERPLAYHLAKKISYEQPDSIFTEMSQTGGSLELTGSANTSMDMVYDF